MEYLRGLRISTFIFSVGLVYFAVHFFVGQQGLLSWRGYIHRADQLSVERDSLVARRALLEARIKNLQPNRANADFVEELAFSQLRLAAPEDVVIVLPKPAGATVVPPSTQTPNL
jgi:cell division protein FtsB